MTWQPIESAPKDGTPILVFASVTSWETYGHSRITAYWDERDWVAYGPAFGEPSSARQRTSGPQRITDCIPTHWMPLPPPPETAP